LPGQTRIVWTLDENKRPRPHRIKIGISDGTATEMIEGDLQENDSLISGETGGSGGPPRVRAAANHKLAVGCGRPRAGGPPLPPVSPEIRESFSCRSPSIISVAVPSLIPIFIR